tara:strand:- start:286 stop:444 length:159 start_codon:yes stop_codon:yes gene_type:complete
MMPQNTVDTIPFLIVMGIFTVIIGNLIYESLRSTWHGSNFKTCPEPCCDGEE